MADRVLYSIYGIAAGAGAPFFWLLWRAFSSRRKWWLTWVQTEIDRNFTTYLTLTICAITLGAIIGYFLGKQRDDLLAEAENIRDANFELEQLAATDGLTGLFNARTMRERLTVEIENAYRAPLGCLLIDLDHFKKINDQHGHPFGDFVLVEVARILKSAVRRIDPVGRLGGEEFMVILPGTPEKEALMVAERIRKSISAEEFSSDGKNIHVTVSVGVAMHPNNEFRDGPALQKAADDALYNAKKSGRNRVVLWGS